MNNFPEGVGANDLVLVAQGDGSGGWRPMVITKVLTRDVPLFDNSGVPLRDKDGKLRTVTEKYAVAGVIIDKVGRTVNLVTKDVVYYHESSLLDDVNIREGLHTDVNKGIFRLSSILERVAELEARVAKLHEAVEGAQV